MSFSVYEEGKTKFPSPLAEEQIKKWYELMKKIIYQLYIDIEDMFSKKDESQKVPMLYLVHFQAQ